MSRVQAVRAAARMTMKIFFADPQWIIPAIIAPFIFTLVALLLFRNETGPLLLYAVLGGGLMGMWGTTVYGSGTSITFDRFNGTMEATLAAPVPLMWIIGGRVAWNTFIGVINGGIILVIGTLWFRTGISIANPLAFTFATVVTYVSLSSFGLMLATVYVLTRQGGFIMNSLEVPVYIATGTMFPVALLPLATQPVAFILGPTWGIEAIRKAAIAGYTGLATSYWTDIGILAIETAAYFAISFYLFGRVERLAKRNGTLEEY
ncbi:MAG: ABC transporter permease [Thaumarchaeota archaeon]|nr:ABC transporter permease [Nitrososphaerota archaeon]